MGRQVRAGLGTALDIVAAVLFAAILLVLFRWAAQLLRWALTRFPARTLGVMLGATAMLSLSGAHPLTALVMVLGLAAAGASLLSVWVNRKGRARRILYGVLSGLSMVLLAAFAWMAGREGFDKEYPDAPLSQHPAVERAAAADPGARGSYKVTAFTYGAGDDKHRAEYGPKADIRSRSVDGSKLLKDREGWRGKVRTWYWGFDTKRMPLNARVWMPEGAGPFPLVLVVHGNHLGSEYSDPGYQYLGELLASRGFIVASVDENFLNFFWDGDYGGKEHPARSWLLLEHLKLWREWNMTKGHRLEGKADLEHVALIGHSRGGEAAATAAEFNRLAFYPGDGRQAFDYAFGIRGVIAIAPSDGQYHPAGMPRRLRDVSYFVIQGGWDGDVSSFLGSRQYAATSFSPNFDGFKSELWIYHANHGQFNTVWGRNDAFGISAWLLNTRALLDAGAQRRIVEIYIGAFLEDVLNGRREYRRLFEDYRAGSAWLPDTTYVSRYQDASFAALADFDEDYDIGRGTAGGAIRGSKLAAWKEQRLGGRFDERQNNVVYLGWRDSGVYELAVPDGLAAGRKGLEFSLADANEMPSLEGEKEAPDAPKTPLNVTVELVDNAGKAARIPLKEAGPVYRPLKVHFRKVPVPGDRTYKKQTEPVLQRYVVPLTGVEAARLRTVRFRFDPATPGTVVLDDIGFSGRSR